MLGRFLAATALSLALLAGSVMPGQAFSTTIPQFTTVANVELDSGAFNPNKNVASVFVQLTDPLNLYLTPDPANGHIISWGFQFSTDNGQTWQKGPIIQEEPAPGLLLAHHPRTGLMPNLFMEGSLILAKPNNTRYRLYIVTDRAATLGASVDIN